MRFTCEQCAFYFNSSILFVKLKLGTLFSFYLSICMCVFFARDSRLSSFFDMANYAGNIGIAW